MDVRTMIKAVSCSASKAWRRSWPDSLFRRIMEGRAPKPVVLGSRDDAVNVYQLRTGHWSRSASYLHRIGRRPESACQQCSEHSCPAARCLSCREGPEYVLLDCPCLASARLRLLGNIRRDPTQLRDGGAVEALGLGYLHPLEPLGYGRWS